MDPSVLLGLATSGAGLLFGKPRKRGAKEAWQTAAETYGLLHKPSSLWSGPKLSGSLSGNELTVDMKNRNTASAETRFRLAMPSLNLGLRLRKKGFWNSLRPRAVIGDKPFDNQVVVNGLDEFALRKFLTAERRTAIQSFLSSFKKGAITDDEISFTTRGYVKRTDEMLGAIDAMLRVASALAEDTQPTSAGRDEGLSADAIALTDAVAAAVPEPVSALEPEPKSETEAELAHAGEPESEQTDARPEADVDAAAPADSITSQESTVGVKQFCATVFAPGALSYSANQIFKESYQGKHIVWTGTLESMTPFTFDFDFGSGRGTKAVLTIVENDAEGSRNVQAVIGLPPDIEGLDDRIGQPVSFTGRLLKVDGLAKRVLIGDAELGR